MKKLTVFFLLIFHFYYTVGQVVPNCPNQFVFDQTTITDGGGNSVDLIIIEAEDVANRNNLDGWEFRTTNLTTQAGTPFPTQYAGDGFLYYNGNNFFNDGGNNVISYQVKISDPGTYRFLIASGIGIFATDLPPQTEHNDTWVNFPDADAYFGYSEADNTITIPNDQGVDQNNPDPNDPLLQAAYPGATYKVPKNSRQRNNGYFKVYMNALNDWWYEGSNNDEDAHDVLVRFDNPGTYTMQVSGRSKGFGIDRLVLYKEEGDFSNLGGRNTRKNAFKDLTSANPTCSNVPSGLNGSKISGTAVTLSWNDNSEGETGFEIEASTTENFATIQSSKSVEANTTTTVFDGLQAAQTYFFRVKAVFTNDVSGNSNTAEVATNAKPLLSGELDLEVIGNNFLEFPESLFAPLFSDIDGEEIQRLKILTLPEGIEVFEVSNVIEPINPNAEFDVDQISVNNTVRFRYQADDTFTGNTSFTLTASDGFEFSEQTLTVNITVLKPQIQLSLDDIIFERGQQIDFGQATVGTTVSKTVQIQNTGNTDLILSQDLTVANSTEFEVTQQPQQALLAAGASTEMTLTFAPTSAGIKEGAQVVFTNNDYDEADQTFTLDLVAEGLIDLTPPEITSPASVSVVENTEGSFYEAVSVENVTFTLGSTNDEAFFSVANQENSNLGNLSFISPPDFEDPQDADTDNIYLIDLIATDPDGNIDSLLLSVTVTDDISDNSLLITSTSSVTVPENTDSVFYTVTADGPASFSLGASSDSALFSLEDASLSFVNPPDFDKPADADSNNVYIVALIAIDENGITDRLLLSVTVSDDPSDNPPTITSNAFLTVAENTSGVLYMVSADKPATFSLGNSNDEEFFNLNNTALSFIEAPDFEEPKDGDADNVYMVNLIATDGAGQIDSLLLTVTVVDVNDSTGTAPLFTSDPSVTVLENTKEPFYQTETNVDATYSMGSDYDEALFTISDGALSFIESPDFETPLDSNGDNVYTVELIAQDATNNTNSLLLNITVEDDDNEVLSIGGREENLVSIYPNPANDRIFIESREIGNVRLMDFTGRIVVSARSVGMLNVENIAAGTYILFVETANGSVSKKVLISR